jgi:hypothetical protein
MSTKHSIRPWLVALGALALLVGFSGLARGQAGKAEDKKAEEKKEDSPTVKVERGAGGKKIYVIKTGFVIEGRIQKPNAFYVLQRSQINYDWAALKQEFVPNITEAVKKHPF